jgi:hypothetical protein
MAYSAPATTGERVAPLSTTAVNHTAQSKLQTLLASWRRHLAAQRMSLATLDAYSVAVRGLDAFSRRAAMITPLGHPRRARAEELMGKKAGGSTRSRL